MLKVEIKKGKVVVGGQVIEPVIKPRKDHGRPKDNQAGLPQTRGQNEKKHRDLRKVRKQPHFNFPNSPQTLLTRAQQESERVEEADLSGQTGIDVVGDEVAASQQQAGEGFEIRQSLGQRKRYGRFLKANGLEPND